ncbi:acidic mammalian chitinase-like [Strigops habroptila]|nr:acidic mammalian chitinase-like [Strigops habroptila]
MVAAFEQEAQQINQPCLMVTAAVASGLSNIQAGYQIPELGKYLDYIHVMTYDFYTSGDGQAGENSPLYSNGNTYLSVEYVMNYWKNSGAPAEKLLVGFPTYGHTFDLQSPSDAAVGAPTSGPGPAGPYTKQAGFLAYYEICTFLNSGATQAWDAPQDMPYAYKSNEWVGYDNIKSFNIKVDWLKKNNFGGAMVWTLDLDDFTGSFCQQGKYPLITTLKNSLGVQNSNSVTAAQPSAPVTEPPSNTGGSKSGGSSVSDFCAGRANGLYADPASQRSFYNCVDGETIVQSCESNLVFDTSCSCCNWP